MRDDKVKDKPMTQPRCGHADYHLPGPCSGPGQHAYGEGHIVLLCDAHFGAAPDPWLIPDNWDGKRETLLAAEETVNVSGASASWQTCLTAHGHQTTTYFGCCPICRKNDGYINIGKGHWFYCKEHKVKWCVGANLFSSWQFETEEKQRATYDRLGFAEFEDVEPWNDPRWIAGADVIIDRANYIIRAVSEGEGLNDITRRTVVKMYCQAIIKQVGDHEMEIQL